MVVYQGIEAYMVRHRDGARYTEYTAPPRSPLHPQAPNEAYIEAVTGERFEVIVRPCQGFDFNHCGAVQFSCSIDGGKRLANVIEAKHAKAALAAKPAKDCLRRFGSSPRFVDGKWVGFWHRFHRAWFGQDSVAFGGDECELMQFRRRRGA